VVLRDARMDVPRHSWARDFLSLRCPEARAVLPASAAHAAAAAAQPAAAGAPSAPLERPGFGEVVHTEEEGAGEEPGPMGSMRREQDAGENCNVFHSFSPA
jgi:hypothetical protein